MRSRLGPERVSERRACRVLGQPRNTQRYQSRRADDEPGLLHEMRLLARQRPRFESARIYRLLTQRGWTVNEKRVHRLWNAADTLGRVATHKRRPDKEQYAKHSRGDCRVLPAGLADDRPRSDQNNPKTGGQSLSSHRHMLAPKLYLSPISSSPISS